MKNKSKVLFFIFLFCFIIISPYKAKAAEVVILDDGFYMQKPNDRYGDNGIIGISTTGGYYGYPGGRNYGTKGWYGSTQVKISLDKVYGGTLDQRIEVYTGGNRCKIKVECSYDSIHWTYLDTHSFKRDDMMSEYGQTIKLDNSWCAKNKIRYLKATVIEKYPDMQYKNGGYSSLGTYKSVSIDDLYVKIYGPIPLLKPQVLSIDAGLSTITQSNSNYNRFKQPYSGDKAYWSGRTLWCQTNIPVQIDSVQKHDIWGNEAYTNRVYKAKIGLKDKSKSGEAHEILAFDANAKYEVWASSSSGQDIYYSKENCERSEWKGGAPTIFHPKTTIGLTQNRKRYNVVARVDSKNGTDSGWTNSGITIATDDDAPFSSGSHVENVTADGFDIVIEGVTDTGSGVNHLQVACWTTQNGQDDINSLGGNWWTDSKYSMRNLGNGKWLYHVNRSNHRNEYGEYQYSIVAWDNVQNHAYIGTPSQINLGLPNLKLNLQVVGKNDEHNKEQLLEGEEYRIKTTITNDGMIKAKENFLGIWDNSNILNNIKIKALDAGESVAVYTEYIPITVGEVSFKACIDYTKIIEELNEGDNEALLKLNVLPRNNKPIAKFTVSPQIQEVYEKLSYNNKSYDPDPWDKITQYEWSYKLQDSDKWIITGNYPKTFFESYGIYQIRLRVKDKGNELSLAMWSDYYEQIVEIKPSLSISGIVTPNPAPAGRKLALKITTTGKAKKIKVIFPPDLLKLSSIEKPLMFEKEIKIEPVHDEILNAWLPIESVSTLDNNDNRIMLPYSIELEAENQYGVIKKGYIDLDVKGSIYDGLRVGVKATGYDKGY